MSAFLDRIAKPRKKIIVSRYRVRLPDGRAVVKQSVARHEFAKAAIWNGPEGWACAAVFMEPPKWVRDRGYKIVDAERIG